MEIDAGESPGRAFRYKDVPEDQSTAFPVWRLCYMLLKSTVKKYHYGAIVSISYPGSTGQLVFGADEGIAIAIMPGWRERQRSFGVFITIRRNE